MELAFHVELRKMPYNYETSICIIHFSDCVCIWNVLQY